MKANPTNLKDVQKYYGGTFIVVPEVSKEKVFIIDDMGAKGLTLRDPSNGELGFISFEGGWEYEIQSPLVNRKQWFQYNNKAYLIQRIPARMWRKGICTENTMVMCFNGDGNLKNASLSWELLNGMLTWKPPELSNLKGEISPGGLALSSTFCYCPVRAQMFLWDHVIGKVAKRTQEVFVPKELSQLKLPTVVNNMKVMYV